MTRQPTAIRPLADDFAVASQLEPMDFAILKARGFRTVINNRPDTEAGGTHLGSREAAALAAAHGLDYVYLPATGLDVTDETTVEAFGRALAESDGPVIAHCATGMRSAILWALARATDVEPEALVERVAAIGFDIGLVRPELEERARHVSLLEYPDPRVADTLGAGAA